MRINTSTTTAFQINEESFSVLNALLFDITVSRE
jgi:hypothetical protein